MPGAFAHITLINLAREPARLEAGPGMPDPAGFTIDPKQLCSTVAK